MTLRLPFFATASKVRLDSALFNRLHTRYGVHISAARPAGRLPTGRATHPAKGGHAARSEGCGAAPHSLPTCVAPTRRRHTYGPPLGPISTERQVKPNRGILG